MLTLMARKCCLMMEWKSPFHKAVYICWRMDLTSFQSCIHHQDSKQSSGHTLPILDALVCLHKSIPNTALLELVAAELESFWLPGTSFSWAQVQRIIFAGHIPIWNIIGQDCCCKYLIGQSDLSNRPIEWFLYEWEPYRMELQSRYCINIICSTNHSTQKALIAQSQCLDKVPSLSQHGSDSAVIISHSYGNNSSATYTVLINWLLY